MTTQINKDFLPLCQWLIDNKPSFHLGKDKTKSILFPKAKGLKEIDISLRPLQNMTQ